MIWIVVFFRKIWIISDVGWRMANDVQCLKIKIVAIVITWMGSNVTCHPIQVNTLHLNPSQIGWYSIYLPLRHGRLSWSRRRVAYRDGLPAHVAVLTRHGESDFVDQMKLVTAMPCHQPKYYGSHCMQSRSVPIAAEPRIVCTWLVIACVRSLWLIWWMQCKWLLVC